MSRQLEEIRRDAVEQGIEFVDLKVLDLVGRLHHLSFPFDRFTPELLREGIGFDGSSYGFLEVEQSDMVLVPDLDTVAVDPFRERPTLTLFAHVAQVEGGRTPFPQDGRNIVRAAERALRASGAADRSLWQPEFEFYLFEDADFTSGVSRSSFAMTSPERFFGNAYHACNPQDRYSDFRDEACRLMQEFGIAVRYHHHEVGAMGQQEIEGWFAPLARTADQAVLAKYILFNLARRHGLRLTFMPKPLFDNAGSGLHLHVLLQDAQGRNLFDGDGYGNLSPLALAFVGGILRHAPALCALTNPSTNSYKRLVPGFEAPTSLSFGCSNRGAAIRIPSYVADPQLRNVEYRPPDFTCNPYLALAAIQMAGLDGILAGIDPLAEGFGPDQPPEAARFLPRSLDDALDALEADHAFLLRDGVFPPELIRRWLETKRAEIQAINRRPHPYEFTMYFDL